MPRYCAKLIDDGMIDVDLVCDSIESCGAKVIRADYDAKPQCVIFEGDETDAASIRELEGIASVDEVKEEDAEVEDQKPPGLHSTVLS